MIPFKFSSTMALTFFHALWSGVVTSGPCPFPVFFRLHLPVTQSKRLHLLLFLFLPLCPWMTVLLTPYPRMSVPYYTGIACLDIAVSAEYGA